VRFDAQSPYGDAFTYQPWEGHYDLVQLNLRNPQVREHIFEAVRAWVNEFAIDGLRLDVAYCLDMDFLRELAAFCRALKADFWLLGEVVHGDYAQWANPQTLDSVTNYEAFKGLYSSLVDKNYFEIAYSLNREFGPEGIYKDIPLYNFVDNHDVDRVAGRFSNPALLRPLYLLLFTMPGVPSIYYGSEWGLAGSRTPQDDSALRPCLELAEMERSAPQPDLPQFIQRLAALRAVLPALRHGAYRQLFVSHEQLAFARCSPGQYVVVLSNAAGQPATFNLRIPENTVEAVDVLNGNKRFSIEKGRLRVEAVDAHWGAILEVGRD
jgi:glycosidase